MSVDSHKLYNKHFLLLMLQYGSKCTWVRAFRLQIDMTVSLFSNCLEVLNEIKSKKNQFTFNSIIVKSLLYPPDTIAKKPCAFRFTINYPSDAFLFSIQHKVSAAQLSDFKKTKGQLSDVFKLRFSFTHEK